VTEQAKFCSFQTKSRVTLTLGRPEFNSFALSPIMRPASGEAPSEKLGYDNVPAGQAYRNVSGGDR
jgi:hypothetical protein